ncbi:hypothetical protein [Actinokineospora diospyrosa]|uniref:Uncharacterized protein n=1 Tax=Actinokineospora diospyrosa TaxID=103728 RepID=A0ABT1IGP8_9PSEU|nr:hypothetical protein [Actinokineospora diospyrosa]MCP2271743.1 hypothetical protein [Actinokineospora diospyrosa]
MEVEVLFWLRGGARLRVRLGQLLLDLLPRPTAEANGGAGRLVIPFSRLELAHTGEVLEPFVWPLPNGSAIHVSPGQALRVAGSGQQWLLPVDDAVGAAEFIARRVTPTADPVPPAGELPDNGVVAPKRILRAMTTPWPGYTVAAVGVGLVFTAAEYAVAEDPLGWITVGLAAALVWGGARFAARFRRSRDEVEANPRGDVVSGWGDHDPGADPVAGWRVVARLD